MIVDLRLKRSNSVMAYNTVEIQFACTVQVHIGVQIYWSETIQPSAIVDQESQTRAMARGEDDPQTK